MSAIAENLARIRERMVAAALRAQRDPAEITLVGVTKTVPAERVAEAIRAGLKEIGENRVQEAAGKFSQLDSPGVRKHLIGHLQSNKARRAVELFDVIQSVDSIELAERIDRIAEEIGKRIEVLLEVNLGDEPSKAGALAEEAIALMAAVTGLPNLWLKGLMAIPPFEDDPEVSRPYFQQLRELRERYNRSACGGASLRELSMGMSHDFEIAIEEGATIVRVGTAIFGERPAKAKALPAAEEGER